MRFVPFVLFVYDEAAVPGDGVPVYAAECAVVEDSHAARSRGHDVDDALDGDGGLSARVKVGYVARVQKYSGQVVLVFTGGEEHIFRAVHLGADQQGRSTSDR
ncbi:hypothetical protein AQJ91_23495 [Streptomyces dysideae]|uniref:Uncharacterized protein n=1 Tax=Streptomyces dysideae TaxID=909626 RepID=A0A101UXV4_9ACTN|nr:hypothetical protein AQJ91_23495 [Streptomyces dysideae]